MPALRSVRAASSVALKAALALCAAACMGSLSGCDALWGGLLADNPRNCAFTRDACGSDEICDAQTQLCRLDVRLDRIEPALVPLSASTPLQLSGRRFAPGMQVLLDGVPLPDVQVLSDSQIKVTAPARSGGPFRSVVELVHPGGVRIRRGDLLSAQSSEARFTVSPLGAGPVLFDLVLGDTNHDGRADLVLSDTRRRQILTFLGQADGTLAASPLQSAIPAAISAGELLLADLNHDQTLDLLISSGPGLAALHGDGTGVFTEAQAVSSPNIAAKLGDFDGDQHLDAVVLEVLDGDLSMSRGRGDGTLAPLRPLTSGLVLRSFVVADFDRDGRSDVMGAGENSVTLLLHEQPQLDPSHLRVTSLSTMLCPSGAGAGSIQGLHAGDFTGDGLSDVLVLCQQDAVVLRNQGGGRFEALPLSLGGLTPQIHAALADFDGDLRTDVVLSLSGVAEVRLLRGDAQAGLRLSPTPVAPLDLSGGTPPLLVFTAGDVDGDTRPDVVIGNRVSQAAGQFLYLRNSSL